jgi:hypothetical protein
LRITNFVVTRTTSNFSMASSCENPCNGLANCPPTTVVEDLSIELAAEAAHDAAVKRNLNLSVRLPSERVQGVCNI